MLEEGSNSLLVDGRIVSDGIQLARRKCNVARIWVQPTRARIEFARMGSNSLGRWCRRHRGVRPLAGIVGWLIEGCDSMPRRGRASLVDRCRRETCSVDARRPAAILEPGAHGGGG